MRLPNRYGSVYKLSGKRRKPWAAVKTQGYSKEGRQIQKAIGYFATKADALQALSSYNNNPYDIEVSKTNFEDIYNQWVAATFGDDSNKNTVRNYSAAYKNCSSIYFIKIADIRLDDLQGCIDGCQMGYQSKKRIKILFNKIYDYCLKYEYVTKNPAQHLTVTDDGEHAEKRAFKQEDIQWLWDNSAQNKYIPIVLILVYSGVRISELLDLEKSDINLTEQYFYVKDSKTTAGVRYVPIADKVLPFWQEFYNNSTCKFLLMSHTQKHMTYDNFKRNYWQILMEQAGWDYKPHETRHTCVSLLVMANVNQTIIKHIVGHKSVMSLTERVYTHIDIKNLVAAINQI